MNISTADIVSILATIHFYLVIRFVVGAIWRSRRPYNLKWLLIVVLLPFLGLIMYYRMKSDY